MSNFSKEYENTNPFFNSIASQSPSNVDLSSSSLNTASVTLPTTKPPWNDCNASNALVSEQDLVVWQQKETQRKSTTKPSGSVVKLSTHPTFSTTATPNSTTSLSSSSVSSDTSIIKNPELIDRSQMVQSNCENSNTHIYGTERKFQVSTPDTKRNRNAIPFNPPKKTPGPSFETDKPSSSYPCAPYAIRLLPNEKIPGNSSQASFPSTLGFTLPQSRHTPIEVCPPHVILTPYPFLPHPPPLAVPQPLAKDVSTISGSSTSPSLGIPYFESSTNNETFGAPLKSYGLQNASTSFANTVPMSSMTAASHLDNPNSSSSYYPAESKCAPGVMPPTFAPFPPPNSIPLAPPFFFPSGPPPMDGSASHFVLVSHPYSFPRDRSIAVATNFIPSSITPTLGVPNIGAVPPPLVYDIKSNKAPKENGNPHSYSHSHSPIPPTKQKMEASEPLAVPISHAKNQFGTKPKDKSPASFTTSYSSVRKDNFTTKSLEASLMDLDRLESKLDLSSTSCKGKQFDSEKQEGFIRTLNSVHTIVRDKLYRARHCTMEQYFSQYHKISRAQVYRLLDCHTILQELSEFPEKPLKQRICRTLKKVAPNPAARKKLWQAVLNKHGHNAVVNLTSGDITSTWKELLTTDSSLQSSLDPVDYRSSLTSPSPLLNGSLNDTFSKSPSYVSPSRSYDSKEVIKQDSVYTSSSNLKPKLPYESEKGNLVLPTRSKRQKQNAKGEQEITKRRRIKKTDVMTNSSSTSNHTYLSNAFSNSTVTQSKLPLPSTSLNSSVSTFPLIFNPNLANTSSHVSDPNYYSMLPLDSAEPKFKFSEFEEWDFEATCMSKLAVTPTLGRIGSLQGNFTNLHFSHPASMIQGQADLNSSTNASSFFSSQQKESSLSLPSEMAHPLMNVQYSDCMGSIPLPNPSNSGLFSRQSTQISKFHHPNKEITSQMALSSTSPSTFLGPCNETTSHSTVPPYLLHTPSSQAYIHLMQQGHLNSNFQYVHPNSLSLDSLFSNTTSTSLSTSSPKNSTFLHSTSGKSLEVLSKSLGLYTDTENPIDHSSTVL